jgi:gliding motility-associated-like protein
MYKTFIYIIFLFCLLQKSFAQLSANAGPDVFACLNGSVVIGGAPSATGGTPPYKYSWSPSTFLSSSAVSNPTVTGITSDMTYTLTVTDFDTTIVTDIIFINLDKIHVFSAGIDTGYCYNQSGGVTIGNVINNNTWHNFSWTPTTALNNPNAARPLANPSVTTTYTLIVSDGLCPSNISRVTVTPFQPPIVDASPDTIIDEGQTITLLGTGGTVFYWQPDYNIKYYNTSNPDVWPITTTIYTLSTTDQHQCFASDIVTVTVANGDKLFFYSAFTPNNDGDNDFFYIGNIEKYPDNNLKIYNRYGKQIYSATNYDNLWNGTYLGNQVPTGTYFYILNDGKGEQYKGSVTILR